MALSGGPDSLALLHLLADLAGRLDSRVVAAHFDHAIRSGSEQEAATVSRWMRELGVPCHVGRPARPVRATQADLRSARYRWLEEVRKSELAQRVALGHQADDQAETVLFRVMRGTDLRGLAGIPALRGHFVRPLLPFRRSRIEAWLRDRGLPWIDDPSNENPRWARARIRCTIIPDLEAGSGDVVGHLLAVSEGAARADALLEDLAARLCRRAAVSTGRSGGGASRVVLDRRVLLAAHSELRARVLRRVARQLGVDLTTGGTRAGVTFMSEGRSGGRIDLGGSLQLSREYEQVAVGPARSEDAARPLIVPGIECGEGSLRIGGRSYEVRWGPAGPQRPHGDRIAVPVPRGHYPLRLREWRAGDRIRLGGGTRKLKKLFSDRRIPAGERARVPVLVDSAERVLWVAGVAVAVPEVGVEYEETLLELEWADA